MCRRSLVAVAVIVTVAGSVTFAGATPAPRALVSVVDTTSYTGLYSVTTDPAGHVFGVDNNSGAVFRFGANFGKLQPLGTDTRSPDGITYHNGLLYLSNSDGSVTSIAATGGGMLTVVSSPSVAGTEASSQQLSWDAQGNLYVANYTGNVIGELAVGANTETTTGLRLPTHCGPFGTLIYAKTLYVVCYDKDVLVKAAMPLTDGESPTLVPTPKLSDPGEMVVDAHHSLYIVNYRTDTLVKVPLTGGKASYVKTYGTALFEPWGLAIAGNSLYTLLLSQPNVLAKISLPPATH